MRMLRRRIGPAAIVQRVICGRVLKMLSRAASNIVVTAVDAVTVVELVGLQAHTGVGAAGDGAPGTAVTVVLFAAVKKG